MDQHQENPIQNLDNQPSEESTPQTQKWQQIPAPQHPLPLYMIDYNQCDSKKCTGKKLSRFELITTLSPHKKYKGIVLSAFGKKLITREDLECCQKYGICVIDCSWNRVEETRESRYKHERKLPFVVAGNPVNYGKPYQLSCVQALATALIAVGSVGQAKWIMSKFGWADGFWSINQGIQMYEKCANQEEMMRQSKANQEKDIGGFQRNYEMPQSSSEEEK